jgi:hypothetical protein
MDVVFMISKTIEVRSLYHGDPNDVHNCIQTLRPKLVFVKSFEEAANPIVSLNVMLLGG